MGRYVLPDLAYDYGALEPHVSGRIMELHHDKHHATYVKGANEAIEGLQEARAKSDFARIAARNSCSIPSEGKPVSRSISSGPRGPNFSSRALMMSADVMSFASGQLIVASGQLPVVSW